MKKSLIGATLLCASALLSSCATGTSSTSSSTSTATESSSSTSETSSTSTSGSTSKSGNSGTGGGGGAGGGSGSSSVTYTGATTFSSDASESGKTYTSTSADESAVLVKNSASATLTNPTINKSGDTSSADNSSFYGLNASLLAISGNAYVKNGTITSTGEGGAGLCGYDDGTVYADGTTISTTKNCAGAVHVCGGGTLYGWDLAGTTAGEHSAAVRSDRGGGTIRLEGGTFTSSGTGSPAVYSTADIAIKGATLSATGSEAAAIEGKNSIRLFDCDLSGNMSDSNQNDNTWGVILYQSMSGDSTVGTSEFDMVGGSLDVKNGGYFHSTNTSSIFVLSDVDMKHTGNDSYEYLIRATGSSRWGDGTGPTCTFTTIGQTMNGKVIYDSASTLNLYLTSSSIWTGATEVSTTYTGTKTSSIYLDSSSKWIVDGNSTIDNLYNAGTIVDASGKTVTIKQGSSSKVSGTSSYTITVNGTYSSTSDVSGASSLPSYDTYKVSEPSSIA
jgi:hypothetical protein